MANITKKKTSKTYTIWKWRRCWPNSTTTSITLNAEVTILFKYLSNFWKSQNFSLSNCRAELNLSSSKDFVLGEHNNDITCIECNFTRIKLYVPLLTLSINDKISLLEIYVFVLYLDLYCRSKRTVFWNKCKSEITTQPKHSNLNYMNDPTFRNTNRLFILSFKNGDNDLREIVW